MKSIGIDLGTTNSVVAHLDGGKPQIIANAEGFRTTPSAVYSAPAGHIVVGNSAKKQKLVNPAQTITSVKRHMGTDWSHELGDKTYTAQEVSARILQKLKVDAEAYLGEPVTDAVITVPAYFNDAQRQATKEAGEIAGLNVLRIINEPTAAALAYGMDSETTGTVMVFDLGGGTFDVSILEIGEDLIEVLSTSGDNNLGGDDFDMALYEELLAQVNRAYPTLELDEATRARLMAAAEVAKQELSAAVSTDVSVPYIGLVDGEPVHFETSVTRSAFEVVTSDLLDRLAYPIQTALKDAGVGFGTLDKVLMVGGSSRIPAVLTMVEDLTGCEPSRSVNPDEVVAEGAALQAGIISGEIDDMLLLDVTPLSLGIRTRGDLMTKIVQKNTPIPATHSETFTTSEDNQSRVKIQVYQGEREIASKNRLLGDFFLEGIAPGKAGEVSISVHFTIDANGILKVTASDEVSGTSHSMTVTGGNGLPPSEIERMSADAASAAEQDKDLKRRILILNSAQGLLSKAKRHNLDPQLIAATANEIAVLLKDPYGSFTALDAMCSELFSQLNEH